MIPAPDLTTTRFVLPPDAKFLPLSELSPRLRARIGVVEEGQSVITRPGFRVTTRLVPRPLAELIAEFRVPSLLTDAVLRFSRANGEDPMEMLDLTFDALATLVETRILVPEGSPDAMAAAASLSAGQAFAGFEIEALVRSLEDSEVYRAHGPGGAVALKIARDGRPALKATLANEARTLDRLQGVDSPRLLDSRFDHERPWLAMEWCDGVSIAIAAQQARAARDRRRLHGLVRRMLEAYGRLHQNGVLHGDIHPGNCLVRDDGRVVILDFGNARALGGDDTIDLARSGIPQFYDPQMAGALLGGGLPPAATAASEQYAIAVLAYLLLTGLQPVESSAIHDELLQRIAEGRAPLPFASRGVAPWPEVETVVRRALSNDPADRFADVATFARAFSAARVPRKASPRRNAAFADAVEGVRTLAPADEPLHHAWFALRAALALEDAELLACADLLARRAGTDCAAHAVAALVARARCDPRMESRAIEAFLAAAPPGDVALPAAVGILDGATSRVSELTALAQWAARNAAAAAEPLRTCVELSLARTGASADLRSRVETLSDAHAGDVWLWALACDVFADERFKARALAAPLPARPLARALALLRLHQLTGEARWIAAARRLVVKTSGLDTALLVAELAAPERAVRPFYLHGLPR